MKNLFVIRHAKSAWDNPSLKDIDRPLNNRGVNDAYKMAAWLYEKQALDCIISSNGIRALHTAVIFAKTHNITENLYIHENLYHPSVSDFIDAIHTVNDSFNNIAVFAHNPGVEEFLYQCNGTYMAAPTCGILHFNFSGNSWETLQFNQLRFVELKIPREID